VLCGGARPLFFLDYFATGKLEPETTEAVVKGIADGCEQAGCALIGGETAELPGFYAPGEYDLAGFCVGIVDRPKIIDGLQIVPGDVILGLPSSGLHSNGFSLARKVLEPLGYETIDAALNRSVGEAMLEPTRIYVKPVLSLLEKVAVKGMVHVTGGGFYENIPRVLPQNTRAVIQKGTWPILPLFQMLGEEANIAEREMFTTFNMGIGLVLIIAASDAQVARLHLQQQGETVYELGMIEADEGKGEVVING
jgi:phosphoribosylformylglycinamidine cyclo-ligase